jgi:hypothetical protein
MTYEVSVIGFSLYASTSRRANIVAANPSERTAMLPFWIFLAFMVGIIVGSLIANGVGALPNAEELEQQDKARFTKIEHSQ